LLQVGDLGEQVPDDILLEVLLLLLLVEPGEVLVLEQLLVLLLVVVVVERSGVALLVDELLTLGQSLLELDLLLAKIPDAVDLPLFLLHGCLLPLLFLFSLLAPGFVDFSLSVFHQGFNSVQLSLSLDCKGSIEVIETLLELLPDLLDLILRIDLAIRFSCIHPINALALSHTIGECPLNLILLVELSLTLGELFLKLFLIGLQLGHLLSVLLFERFSEIFHCFSVLFAHLSIQFRHKTVWQVLGEDFLFLFNLLLLQIRNVGYLTILAALLHFFRDLRFLAHVFDLDIADILLKLVVNVGLFLLEFLQFSWLMRPADDCIDTTLTVGGILTQFLLLGDLFLHHGKNFFLELDTLLLIKLKKQIFQLLLMLIIDKSLNGCWDLFRSEIESHLGD